MLLGIIIIILAALFCGFSVNGSYNLSLHLKREYEFNAFLQVFAMLLAFVIPVVLWDILIIFTYDFSDFLLGDYFVVGYVLSNLLFLLAFSLIFIWLYNDEWYPLQLIIDNIKFLAISLISLMPNARVYVNWIWEKLLD